MTSSRQFAFNESLGLMFPGSHTEHTCRHCGKKYVVSDVFLIVSALFKSALPDRTDLLIPNETVRDSAGKIIGCKSFA